MSISVGSNTASHRSHSANANSADNAGSKAQPKAADTTDRSSSSSTSVTLSDEAKAFLARKAAAADGDQPSVANLTTNARAWFDQQYASLGISSAMLDGQVAVDLSRQSRATLSVVADNAQSQFTPDEVTAAAKILQSRFDDAMAPHVAIARHTGDYASLYTAASDYLDKAGAAEKATRIWKDQKQAVLEGLAAAHASFGKAPATGNDNDPVALLDKTSVQTPPAAGSTRMHWRPTRERCLMRRRATPRTTARNWFSPRAGRPDNKSISPTSTMGHLGRHGVEQGFFVLRAGSKRCEGGAFNQRTRSSILNAFDPSSGGGGQGSSIALLQQYASMSPEERSVLGFTDDFANKIAQNYRTMSSIQSSFGSSSSGGLAAYL